MEGLVYPTVKSPEVETGVRVRREVPAHLMFYLEVALIPATLGLPFWSGIIVMKLCPWALARNWKSATEGFNSIFK